MIKQQFEMKLNMQKKRILKILAENNRKIKMRKIHLGSSG